jgi:nicotinic acid phosphoribosyltransferase
LPALATLNMTDWAARALVIAGCMGISSVACAKLLINSVTSDAMSAWQAMDHGVNVRIVEPR